MIWEGKIKFKSEKSLGKNDQPPDMWVMYDRFESSLVIVGGSANRQNKLRANSRKWVRSSKIETPDYSSKCKKGNTPPVSTKSDDFSAGTTENLARHTKFSQIFYLGTLRYFYLAIKIIMVLYVLCSDES